MFSNRVSVERKDLHILQNIPVVERLAIFDRVVSVSFGLQLIDRGTFERFEDELPKFKYLKRVEFRFAELDEGMLQTLRQRMPECEITVLQTPKQVALNYAE